MTNSIRGSQDTCAVGGRVGELLASRERQQGVSGTRQVRSDAVAPVVAVQAQNQASQGRELSTLASLRALWARTAEQAWARRAVGGGVKFCPRAGWGKSACPIGGVGKWGHGRTSEAPPHARGGNRNVRTQ